MALRRRFNILIVTLFVYLNVSPSASHDVEGSIMSANASAPIVRSVFLGDVVKFNCSKQSQASSSLRSKNMCTWNLSFGNSTREVTGKCFKTTNRIRGEAGNYTGYVEIVEGVTSIECMENETSNAPQPLFVQNIQLAEPISSFGTLKDFHPKIVLQRYSNDYYVRLGVHDVTNQNVSVNGDEVDSLKLLCIHSSEQVAWLGYTEPRKRLLTKFRSRGSQWVQSKLKKAKTAENYTTFLEYVRNIDVPSTNSTRIDFGDDGIPIYTIPLTLRSLANGINHTIYRCQDSKTNQESHVNITVQNPRIVGPEEIILIEQIISLLLNDQNGGKTWPTLASVLSVILLLFVYYCKKKLEQPGGSQDTPPANPPNKQEETDVRTRLNPPVRLSTIRESGENRTSQPLSQGAEPDRSSSVFTEVSLKKASE